MASAIASTPFWSRETPPAKVSEKLGADVMSLIMTKVIGHHAKIDSKREYVIKEVDETMEIVRDNLHRQVVWCKGIYDAAIEDNAVSRDVLSGVFDELTELFLSFMNKYDATRRYVIDAQNVLDSQFEFNVVGGLQDAGNRVIGDTEELAAELFNVYVVG